MTNTPAEIYVDTREKPRAIVGILAGFEKRGVKVIRQVLGEGDYMLSPDAKTTVDRKQNLGEVCNNLTWDKARFQRELRRARNRGVTMYVLVEHGGAIRSLEDVDGWKNPRLQVSPKAVSGVQLRRLMRCYTIKYGVNWRFCDKRHTADEILRILQAESGGA